MPNAFDLLAEPLRRALWDMQWTELRPVQVDAIHAVLESDRDLIISARTASGKTEAAFLPILSLIHEGSQGSIRAVYVGPLKALINDQFRRLEDLCAHAEIPVHRWHGDVAASRKTALLKRPSGVLLITPESVESLFVNHSAALSNLFHDLSFVVIDELHALHGSERGTHLRSLLFRLDRHSKVPPRIIALSATLGDPSRSARWMRPDDPNRVQIIRDESFQKSLRFGLFAYEHKTGASDAVAGDLAGDSAVGPPAAMVHDLFEAFHADRGLLFANSRGDVEWYADTLNEYGAGKGRRGQFLVHHGSLSKEVREDTERLMQEESPYTTVCTSSLELGIDIGNVALVGQIGCPYSVSSLVQRLGRSGRRDEQPQCMRLSILEAELPSDAPIYDRLRPRLLQAIALTDLMLKKWVEPPDDANGDLSTLVQQVLSVIRETGGLNAPQLFARLATQGAFRHANESVFREVLRSIAQHDLIEQAPDGNLILGLAGERVVESYEFYSAFATSPEYRVVHQGALLGTLPSIYIPPVGDHLLLAGRRWQVIGADHDRREITVRPGRGRKAPLFDGGGGIIHPAVRSAMRDALFSDRSFSYLNDAATRLLSEARMTARNASLHRHCLLEISPKCTLWFTWTGSNRQATLRLLAVRSRLEVTDRDIALEFAASAQEVRAAFADCLRAMPDAMIVAALEPHKERRKYDMYLPDDLLNWSLAQEVVDLNGARELIETLLLQA